LLHEKRNFLLAGILLAVLLAACARRDQPITVTPPVVTRAPATAVEITPETVSPTDTPDAEPTTAVSPATPTSPPTVALPTNTPEPTAAPIARPPANLTLEVVVSGIARPTYLTHAFDERLFVTEQAGRIRIIQNGDSLAQPFLDIADRVNSNANEQGLLGLAFHPNYVQNGLFFVNYTNANSATVIARYQVSDDDPNQADKASERILLTISQPYNNHNGGQIKFGPDG
jgi:glucose/arabinose dehydrogenase